MQPATASSSAAPVPVVMWASSTPHSPATLVSALAKSSCMSTKVLATSFMASRTLSSIQVPPITVLQFLAFIHDLTPSLSSTLLLYGYFKSDQESS